MSWITQWITSHWYAPPKKTAFLLKPFAKLYEAIGNFRRWSYQKNLCKTYYFPVPVIVVGNITVGGTGKTLLVAYLTKALQSKGYRVGIVSRGYGGTSRGPRLLGPDCSPEEVGDEAFLLYQKTGVPLVVARRRPEAVRTLLENASVDVVLSDDGFQHFALGRAINIVMIDGRLGLGNGAVLPLGPLRESPSSLRFADFMVEKECQQREDSYLMRVVPKVFRSVSAPDEVKPLEYFFDQKGYAVAGIGNPESFFSTLSHLGMKVMPQIFPDHASYRASDFKAWTDYPIWMTEKDAVKCRSFGLKEAYYLDVDAEISPNFLSDLLKKLELFSETQILKSPE